jgi:hypothetical protein
MKSSSKALLGIVAVLLTAAPLALILTWLLYPLWSWLDVIVGLEALGHSGPAAWCYELVYLVLVIIGVRYVVRKKLAGQQSLKD